MIETKDKHNTTIIDLLKSYTHGLTISEIMQKTKLARHTVLARLHKLEGANKVHLRQINMAKLYYWNEEEEPKEDKGPKITKLKENNIKQSDKKINPKRIDIEKIKEDIKQEMSRGKLKKELAQVKEDRTLIKQTIDSFKDKKKITKKQGVLTGIPGFDDLINQGIPEGSSVLVAGGAGSGKTIFCLQTLNYHALKGKKCLYMSFEESEEKLIQHMEGFGWNPKELIKKGNLMIKRFNPFDITRSVDALLMKAKGELLIDVEPVILPENYSPDFIVVDSLTAIASAFIGKEDSYRIYIEQLFRFFESIKATSFLITETKQIPTIFSQSGVEEFLADGVIVLYSIKRGNIRENAIEVLKLRGGDHEKRIVAYEINDTGLTVYPEQEVFGEINEKE